MVLRGGRRRHPAPRMVEPGLLGCSRGGCEKQLTTEPAAVACFAGRSWIKGNDRGVLTLPGMERHQADCNLGSAMIGLHANPVQTKKPPESRHFSGRKGSASRLLYGLLPCSSGSIASTPSIGVGQEGPQPHRGSAHDWPFNF